MMEGFGDTEGRKVAFFDFDGTLAAGDSFWPFLVAVAGWPRCLIAGAAGFVSYLLASGTDRRTAMKEKMIEMLLSGLRLEDIAPAIERMKSWPRWLATSRTLRRHHAAGHYIVIATGSLNLYIEAMLGDLPHHAVLSTEIEVVGGVITGRMINGNCVRLNKAKRVALFLKDYGPFVESWAYGNAPHDLPMMELTTHKVVI